MAKTLTDTKIRSMKATGKDYRVGDGEGLYIKITKTGAKSWQFRYKGKWSGLGSYPSVSLKKAREKAFEYRQILSNGKDPKIELEKAKQQNNNIFSTVSERAFDNKHPSKLNGWKSEKSYLRNYSIYTRFILPKLKNINMNDIEPYQLVKLIENQTPSNQRKIKSILNMIFNYAVGKCIIKYNIVHGIQLDKENTKGFDFIDPLEDPYNFSNLINDIDNYKGQHTTRMALKLAMLIGFRPQNIVSLEWSQIKKAKVDNKEVYYISIKAENMKMGRDFRQPLSKQAHNILLDLEKYNGKYTHVFHSSNKKDNHITTDSLSKALRNTLGYDGIKKPKQQTHGFRKTIRTYISSIRSKHNWCSDSVRMILSHSKENAIDNIYDKNDFLIERSQMLQLWADYVDHIRVNSNVINIDDVG